MDERLALLIDRGRRTLQRLRWWIGIPIALVALVMIGRQFYLNWTVVQGTVVHIGLGWVLVGTGITSIAVALLGWNWISVLGKLGIEVYWPDAIRIYFTANLARYAPGGIWHFAGRTLWLIQQGHRFRSAAESLVLEQGITLVTAGGIGLFLSWVAYQKPFAITSVALSGAIAVFSIGVKTAVSKNHKSSARRPSLQNWAVSLVGYSFFWVLYGLATLCLAVAIAGQDVLTVANCAYLIGATALSWASGYAVFIVPGGWGVRELVFMHLLSKEFPGAVVVLLPVLVRSAQIAAELLCVVTSSLIFSRRKYK